MISQRASITAALRQWHEEGRSVALATVVTSSQSAPRGLGAQLVVTDGGSLWTGGLSGGCAEVAVLLQAQQLLSDHSPNGAISGLLIPLTHDELGSSGPACGSTLHVLIERADIDLLVHLESVVGIVRKGRAAYTRRSYVGTADALLRTSVSCTESEGIMPTRRPSPIHWETSEDGFVLSEILGGVPTVVLGGAGDIATEMIRLLSLVGWRTVVMDAREAFISQTTRLASPDNVIEAWPDEGFARLGINNTFACVALSHDEKLDTPFLENALHGDPFYVGSVGSRVVQQRRRQQLTEAVGVERAADHHGPAGLNLGGSGAAEIALSIVAEMVAEWNGRDAAPLRSSDEPIRAR